MPHHYFNPVRCVFGSGALSELPGLVGDRQAVLVTFPEARSLGLVDRLESLLGSRLRRVIDAVQPNPDVAELSGMHQQFWRDDAAAEVLVAVGGGSVIDTAKTLMVDPPEGGFEALVSALQQQRNFVPARVKHLIAVPTTAGTGSEVTPWATIWDRQRQLKHSLHLPQTWPAVALVDPDLMLTLPAAVTLQSGLDALSHALEAIWNTNANPVSDTLAVGAASDILEALPALMARPSSPELRSRMATAALKAGLAFSNTRTALAHSISYQMTLRHGLPHGLACSFPLPMVLEMAIGRIEDRDRVLSLALGPLDAAPARLREFLGQLGVKTRFADYGVGDREATQMVADALQGVRGLNFIGALTRPGQGNRPAQHDKAMS
jgi:phosphonate metabolism-associated iron-containing alcohol dehydrogenase